MEDPGECCRGQVVALGTILKRHIKGFNPHGCVEGFVNDRRMDSKFLEEEGNVCGDRQLHGENGG